MFKSTGVSNLTQLSSFINKEIDTFSCYHFLSPGTFKFYVEENSKKNNHYV